MNHEISRDGWALLLLCSTPLAPGQARVEPLGPAEWHRIGSRLRQAGIASPGELLDVGREWLDCAGLEPGDPIRLCRLLERRPALEAELQRLAEQGIHAVTTADAAYPEPLKRRLRGSTPPVLFAAGDWGLLAHAGLAIVGSRDVDEAGAAFARAVAQRSARDGLSVVTGGARGVDRIAMEAALEAGGAVVGVMPGDLERTAAAPDVLSWLDVGSLLLLSPYHPKVGFSVGNAMARNKLIYALADWGLVVSAAHGKGGTWAGAREALRRQWVPVFVRDDPRMPDGNRELLRPAALPFPDPASLGPEPLPAWLARQSGLTTGLASPTAAGGDLFPQVWPALAGFLRTPRRLDEVAAAFGLVPEQARAWLQQAADGGWVVEAVDPPAYHLVEVDRGS